MGHVTDIPWKAGSAEVQIVSYSPLQSHTLSELDRLVRWKQEYERQPQQDPFLLRLLQKAAFAAYLECQELDLEEEARDILKLASCSRAIEGTFQARET